MLMIRITSARKTTPWNDHSRCIFGPSLYVYYSFTIQIQALHSDENFTCTPTELDILHDKIEFMQDVFWTLRLTYNMVPRDEPVIGVDNKCAFWNVRVLKNCTVSSPELLRVQQDIVEPRFGGQCSLCPVNENPITESAMDTNGSGSSII